MPYSSDKQRKFFELCRHTPQHARGSCPDEKTLSEFHNAEFHATAERRMKAKRVVGRS
jgi:hypothetical protein